MFAFVIFTGINKIMGEAKIMEICMKMWAGIYKEILSGHMDVVRYLVLLMVTMAAAADDYKRYKISNRIIIGGLILSAMVCIAEMYMMHVVSKNGVDITYGGYKGYKDIGLMYLSGMVWALFVSYVLYKVRAIGAGDVKLFMVVGTFMGYKDVMYIIVIALFAGAFIGVAEALGRKEIMLVTGKSMHKFHFSYAIMAGVCMMVCLKSAGI